MNEQYRDELGKRVGHFTTPALVIGGDTLLGFGMNMVRVRELLQQGCYLEAG